MSEQPVSCKEVAKHICENLGEQLDSPHCKAIKKHLEDCEECREYFSSVERTIDFYKKYDINMPADAHNRLMQCLGLIDEE